MARKAGRTALAGAGWLEFAAEGAVERGLEDGVRALPAGGFLGFHFADFFHLLWEL